MKRSPWYATDLLTEDGLWRSMVAPQIWGSSGHAHLQSMCTLIQYMLDNSGMLAMHIFGMSTTRLYPLWKVEVHMSKTCFCGNNRIDKKQSSSCCPASMVQMLGILTLRLQLRRVKVSWSCPRHVHVRIGTGHVHIRIGICATSLSRSIRWRNATRCSKTRRSNVTRVAACYTSESRYCHIYNAKCPAVKIWSKQWSKLPIRLLNVLPNHVRWIAHTIRVRNPLWHVCISKSLVKDCCI